VIVKVQKRQKKAFLFCTSFVIPQGADWFLPAGRY